MGQLGTPTSPLFGDMGEVEVFPLPLTIYGRQKSWPQSHQSWRGVLVSHLLEHLKGWALPLAQAVQ